jgi:TetR/AcrR family transcriptional repressor of nem operon
MQVSREKAAENRERIMETAARMFREAHRRVDATAPRTHGGFYNHFGSKDDLTAEAVTRALCHEGPFGVMWAPKLDVHRHRLRCLV